MNTKEFLELYGLDDKKQGLFSNTTKQCQCGQSMDIGEKACPFCGTALPKKALINVNKNTAIAKRYEGSKSGNLVIFSYYQLLSKGFELYESEVLKFQVNLANSHVEISNTKVFSTLETNEEFRAFLEKYFPGFIHYIMNALSQFQYDYAISKLTSLSPDQLTNFLNVHLNYKALQPYLRGYKVFYYGAKVNLKSYFPDIDFNDENDVARTGLRLKLLLTWDIKNENYIQEIINLSTHTDDSKLNVLEAIIDNMVLHSTQRYGLDYNDMIETFSLLYNQEISLDDFIRIYTNSRENYFNKLNQFRKHYKKCVNTKIDWSNIEKIDRKSFGILESKNELIKDVKIKKDMVNAIYETLDKDPLQALQMIAANQKGRD